MSLMTLIKRLLVGREEVATGDPQRVQEVEALLTEMRPVFLADGGDMRLVSVEDDGGVVLRLVGACHGCGVSTLTLQGALRPKLRERCSWFTELRTVDG